MNATMQEVSQRAIMADDLYLVKLEETDVGN
jgi:hypothetical protein